MKTASLLLFLAVSIDAHAAKLYPDPSRAAADISAALEQARQEGKRVLIDFGGDWCTDCKVLDLNFRRPENAALIARRFVLVRVNVGERGIVTNFDVAHRYGIPLGKGVPALAVLDARGRLLHAQKAGEFENMRAMDPASVHEFLLAWSRGSR